MSINIDSFISYFDGGARSYLFSYSPSFLGYADSTTQYFVRSLTLPETSVDELVLTWRGFDHKVGAKRVYSDWTITFNSDRNYELREKFENWADKIAYKDEYGKSKDYFSDQVLTLLDYDGNPVRHVKLFGAWPKNVGPVTLDYGNQDVSQFDVTFSYQYFRIITV